MLKTIVLSYLKNVQLRCHTILIKSQLEYRDFSNRRSVFIFEDNTKARRFLQPIIDNLNQLQLHGLVINGSHLKFSFSTIIADNLAAHLVGGFQTCFSNGYFCRRCYITYADKNLPIPLTEIKSRMINDHDDLVHELIRNPNNAPLMGVVGPSLFNDLIGFHATTSLPADCMHDFLEGVCPIVIMSLLKEASSMRLITYGEIQRFSLRTFVEFY